MFASSSMTSRTRGIPFRSSVVGFFFSHKKSTQNHLSPYRVHLLWALYHPIPFFFHFPIPLLFICLFFPPSSASFVFIIAIRQPHNSPSHRSLYRTISPSLFFFFFFVAFPLSRCLRYDPPSCVLFFVPFFQHLMFFISPFLRFFILILTVCCCNSRHTKKTFQ